MNANMNANNIQPIAIPDDATVPWFTATIAEVRKQKQHTDELLRMAKSKHHTELIDALHPVFLQHCAIINFLEARKKQLKNLQSDVHTAKTRIGTGVKNFLMMSNDVLEPFRNLLDAPVTLESPMTVHEALECILDQATSLGYACPAHGGRGLPPSLKTVFHANRAASDAVRKHLKRYQTYNAMLFGGDRAKAVAYYSAATVDVIERTKAEAYQAYQTESQRHATLSRISRTATAGKRILMDALQYFLKRPDEVHSRLQEFLAMQIPAGFTVWDALVLILEQAVRLKFTKWDPNTVLTYRNGA